MTRIRSPFTTIRTEGALLPVDLLQRVMDGDTDLGGLTPDSYHLSGEKLNEAINRSWNHLLGSWAAFLAAAAKLPEGDPGTTATRERWLLPLFNELGYGRLPIAKAIEIEGKPYPISHSWGITPIHLIGCNVDLDKRAPGVTGASRSSPHSLVQEVLNRDLSRLWGFVSNGKHLRVLRDNASLTRLAYLEFDLEDMMNGEVYADFALLWLVCHQSRVEGDRHDTCWLEKWSKAAQERGTRALDTLRDGVEEAIKALGSGFLAHPANTALKAKLRSGDLIREDYYRQVLRLVYRLIFLFAAEDRDLLLDPNANPTARERYFKFYSTEHLRQLAEHLRGGRHTDLYSLLKVVTDTLGGREKTGSGKAGLGLPELGSFLFSSETLPDLDSAELENRYLLSAIRSLAFTIEGHTRRAVDYKNLGPEELGSVYESLLELHPILSVDAGTFDLLTASGHERKTTGSYYTPTSLIQVLLDSALDPVIDNALQKTEPASEARQSAILNLKVCDPACGSGHFLIAAAYRLARRLASLRSGDEEPSPTMTRTALREVVAHCVYGVDINPMAVELCKVNLWLEALDPGKPLSFLDAHIQCGDSLVGVGPGLDISEIPDEAFTQAFGDDKVTSFALKKRNKVERSGQIGLDAYVVQDKDDLHAWIANQAQSMDTLPEETAEQVWQKAHDYKEYLNSPQYNQRKLEYDIWTAAFYWKIEAQHGSAGILAPTQEMLRRLRSGGSIPPELVRRVAELAQRNNFFHWELLFPTVFIGIPSGFDCILGNPPWERIKLQEEEFFAQRDPEIATAPNKAARQKLIEALLKTHLLLATEFTTAKGVHDKQGNFMRSSDRYPLSGIGDVNTYAIFAELARELINSTGRIGVIVPTGIATDDATKEFFKDVIDKCALVSLFDFENREGIFPGIHRSYKFCLLTMGRGEVQHVDFVFYCTRIEHLYNDLRHFSLSPDEIALFNPNTRTAPIFRNHPDADIAKNIYLRIPILVKEGIHDGNKWDVEIGRMFHSSEDSDTFIPSSTDSSDLLPLYEAKCFWQYDHRFSTYENVFLEVDPLSKYNPNFLLNTRYSIVKADIPNKYRDKLASWYLAYRRITSPTNERTLVSSILPKCGLLDSGNIFFNITATTACLLLANLNSLVSDYLCRQAMGGNNLHVYIIQQIPILSPTSYSSEDMKFIYSRVLELVYTASDLRSFADDMSYKGEPFRWDEVRRAQLRAELDAYYSRLYGLNRKQLRYILDPADLTPRELVNILDPWEEINDPIDLAGYADRCARSTFPGETFRVLKEKEIRQFGEYRTRRLVLEAWDKLVK